MPEVRVAVILGGGVADWSTMSGLIGGWVAAGVKLDDDLVWVRNLDGPADVAVDHPRARHADEVEVGAPGLQLLVTANAERDSGKAAECDSPLGFTMQTQRDATGMLEDYPDDALFFFEGEDGLESEQIDVPIAALQDLAYRQPDMVHTNDQRDGSWSRHGWLVAPGYLSAAAWSDAKTLSWSGRCAGCKCSMLITMPILLHVCGDQNPRGQSGFTVIPSRATRGRPIDGLDPGAGCC